MLNLGCNRKSFEGICPMLQFDAAIFLHFATKETLLESLDLPKFASVLRESHVRQIPSLKRGPWMLEWWAVFDFNHKWAP